MKVFDVDSILQSVLIVGMKVALAEIEHERARALILHPSAFILNSLWRRDWDSNPHRGLSPTLVFETELTHPPNTTN